MEEDEFGELYGDHPPQNPFAGAGDLQKAFPAFNLEEDESDDADAERNNTGGLASGMLAPLKQLHKSRDSVVEAELGTHYGSTPVNAEMSLDANFVRTASTTKIMREHDSDEDDDMILLAYTSKNAGQMPLSESDRSFAAIENGAPSFGSGIRDLVPEPGSRPNYANNMDNPKDYSTVIPGLFGAHLEAIPGLSTASRMPPVAIGCNDGTAKLEWEAEQAVQEEQSNVAKDKAMSAAATIDDDWDSDSEDDLKIVLNNDNTFVGRVENTRTNAHVGDSEDEDDGLDLVILNEGEAADDTEEHALAQDVQAVVGVLEEGSTGDEKGLVEKGGPGVVPNQPGPKSGYGYQGYSSPFKYLRPKSTPGVPGQALLSRPGHLKGVIGRGAGKGLFGYQTMPQLPMWQMQVGFEFSLPPSMTIFEIDLEAFAEKPWRNPTADISDFFNFDFNEQTWKDYCKQMEQLCLESTMQSKIRVYESGRSEQDYDPDMPPELLAATGVNEGTDRNQSHSVEAESVATPIGRGRGHISIFPTGRPIQVEGGLGDRKPSMDAKRQRIRDSDAIILIDAVEEAELLMLHHRAYRGHRDANKDEECEEVEKEEVEEDEGQEAEEGEGEGDMSQNTRIPKHVCHEEHAKHSSSKEARFLRLQSPSLEREARSRVGEKIPGFDLLAKSVVKSSFKIALPDDLIRESSTALQRAMSSRPGSPAMIMEDIRKASSGSNDLYRNQSSLKSVNDEEESCHKRSNTREACVQKGGSFVKKSIVSNGKKLGDRCMQERQEDKQVASPEGSWTALRDEADVRKLIRITEYKRGSSESGDSIRNPDRQEGGTQSRKHKTPSGREENGRRESRDYKDKQQDVLPPKHDRGVEKLHDSFKREGQSIMDRNAIKENTKHRKSRECEIYPTKKEKEEDGRRKENMVRGDKEAEQNWMEAKKRNETRKRQVQREFDHADRRGTSERDARHHRQREIESMDRQDANRRKREEYRRKEQSEEKATELRAKPKYGSERDTDIHGRKKEESWKRDRTEERRSSKSREEESWKRDRIEERHRSKSQDRSWKERDHSHHRSREHQDIHTKEHKGVENAEKRDQAVNGRSKRHVDDVSGHGKDGNLGNEASRHAEDREYVLRDKRKHEETRSKEKARSHESRVKPSSEHACLYQSDSHNSHSASQDRGFSKYSESADNTRAPSDKDRSESRRYRESDKERNGAVDASAAYLDSNKRIRLNDENEVPSQMRTNEPVKTPAYGSLTSMEVTQNGDELASGDQSTVREDIGDSKDQLRKGTLQITSSKDLVNKMKDSVPKTELSEKDEVEAQKGRSKLERWTSHRDIRLEPSQRLSPSDELKREVRDEGHGSGDIYDGHEAGSTEMDNRPSDKSPLDVVNEKGVGHDNVDGSSQQDRTTQHVDTLAKLEKRRERFKDSVEEQGVMNTDTEDHQVERELREEAKAERPPRKRRWVSG